MSEVNLKKIADSLERLVRLSAFQVLSRLDGKNQAQKMVQLRGFGFSNGEIAELLGVSSDTVKVSISTAKKKGRGGKKKKTK